MTALGAIGHFSAIRCRTGRPEASRDLHRPHVRWLVPIARTLSGGQRILLRLAQQPRQCASLRRLPTVDS